MVGDKTGNGDGGKSDGDDDKVGGQAHLMERVAGD